MTVAVPKAGSKVAMTVAVPKADTKVAMTVVRKKDPNIGEAQGLLREGQPKQADLAEVLPVEERHSGNLRVNPFPKASRVVARAVS